MFTLNIQERDVKTSPDEIRSKGMVPCVYYGPKDQPVAIAVNKVEFLKVLRDAGESAIVVLESPKGKIEALIHDVAYEPVRNEVVHADFYVPEKGKKVEVAVPLEFTGVSAAVKDLGGTLVKVMHEIEIEALPKDLPHNIIVDISALTDLDSQITAGDLKLPEGVTLAVDAEEVVASVSVTEEEVETAPADLSAIELAEKKGKKEEEAEK